jgi:hypothetical protein
MFPDTANVQSMISKDYKKNIKLKLINNLFKALTMSIMLLLLCWQIIKGKIGITKSRKLIKIFGI